MGDDSRLRGHLSAIGWLGVAVCTAVHIPGANAQTSQYALRFHGTGVGPPGQQDRVRIPIDDDAPGPDASAACDVGSGGFTIELWLRGAPEDNNTSNDGGDNETFDVRWIDGNIIVDRDIWGGSERKWGISIAGGFVRFGTSRGDAGADPLDSTIEGNVNVLDGQWHHIACVRDASTGRKLIYVDGAPDFSGAPGTSTADISYPDDGAPGQLTEWGPYIVLAAEKHDAGAAYPSFNGYLDEMRIWDHARTLAEILADQDRVIEPDAPGLVAYYRFEEGAGTVLLDSSAAGSPAGELIAGVPGNGEWVAAADDAENTAPVGGGVLPPGFVRSTVATGLNEPTVLEFAPDGRLFIGERGGRVWIHEDGGLLPDPLIQINADTLNGERGLVGLTLDPDFTSNGYLYAYYTTPEPRNRVGRFTVTGDTADPASEAVIWQNQDLAADFHHGGAIHFGPDGHLYIATGDQFASATAQDLSSQHGKMLRILPDGSIPPDNPFVGTSGARPEIWASGLRNPFRWVFDDADGRMYIGNVGGNSPDSWEELNVGMAGANYGWPNQEGPECFISDCSNFAFPIWGYRHDDSAYHGGTAQGSIVVGPVYRAQSFPPQYQGNLFVGDYANRWIRRLILDISGNVLADLVFLGSPEAGTIVDLEVGPDGALYYVTIGVPWSGNPDAGAVYRIAYAGFGNQPPSVTVSAEPTSGSEPLTVQFSSSGTVDPDSGPEPLSYRWEFGDGNTSGLPDPQHSYVSRGMYTAFLTVGDGADQTVSDPLLIRVGNPPIPQITAPPALTTYRAGELIEFEGIGVDAEDGLLGPAAFTWRVLLIHAAHSHPALGPLDGVLGGSFLIPSTGHAPENTYYQIQLTVTDSDGLEGMTTRDVFPETSALSLDTVPSGVPLFLDGEAVATPRIYESLVGFQHTLEAPETFTIGGIPHSFRCWTTGDARIHSIVAAEEGTAAVATYEPIQGEQSVTVTPGSNDRDADYNPAFGEELGNFYDAGGLCVGRDGDGQWQAAMAFNLPIPQGAIILSASLQVNATADQSGAPLADIRAYDVADVAPFDAGHVHALTSHHPTTSPAVPWTMASFIPGMAYESPELSALVQSVVNRGDWQVGNAFGVVLDGSPSEEGNWSCVRNFASGTPARLSVSYAVPTTGSADLDCDLDVDLEDFAIFQSCLDFVSVPPGCTLADRDGDGDVDLVDFAGLAETLDGPAEAYGK